MRKPAGIKCSSRGFLAHRLIRNGHQVFFIVTLKLHFASCKKHCIFRMQVEKSAGVRLQQRSHLARRWLMALSPSFLVVAVCLFLRVCLCMCACPLRAQSTRRVAAATNRTVLPNEIWSVFRWLRSRYSLNLTSTTPAQPLAPATWQQENEVFCTYLAG